MPFALAADERSDCLRSSHRVNMHLYIQTCEVLAIGMLAAVLLGVLLIPEDSVCGNTLKIAMTSTRSEKSLFQSNINRTHSKGTRAASFNAGESRSKLVVIVFCIVKVYWERNLTRATQNQIRSDDFRGLTLRLFTRTGTTSSMDKSVFVRCEGGEESTASSSPVILSKTL